MAPVLAKLGQSPGMVRERAQQAVDKLPRAHGGDEPHMSRELTNVTEMAEKYRKDLRDDYVSVEHLLLAMNQRLGVGSEELLQVLRDVRGGQCVTDQNPEEKYQALQRDGRDLVEIARQGKIDPVIGCDEEIRRTISRCSPGGRRRIRPHRRARRGEDGDRRRSGHPHSQWRRAGGPSEQADRCPRHGR